MLVNGFVQVALGKVQAPCTLQGSNITVRFFVIKDSDFTFPCELGLDLTETGMLIHFVKRAYSILGE